MQQPRVVDETPAACCECVVCITHIDLLPVLRTLILYIMYILYSSPLLSLISHPLSLPSPPLSLPSPPLPFLLLPPLPLPFPSLPSPPLPLLLQFLLAMTALAVLTLHCFLKPYKERYINIVEALILLDLLLVTGLLIDPESQVPIEFDFFMILLPFVYFVLYLLWRTFQFF